MAENFDEILDKCIDSIGSGDSIDDCLARYPEYASDLLPLLRTMTGAQDAVTFEPSAEKKQAARQQLMSMIGTQKSGQKRSFLSTFFGKTKVWAGAAAMAAVALIAVYGIMPLLGNSGTPIQQGDFALMISDDPAVVDLFDSVEVTIDLVKLYHSTEGWQDITPETNTVDLTDIKGALAQKIWEGEILVGEYTKVRVDIGGIDAVIGGVPISISFSASLVIEVPFQIIADTLTNYVFDMAVFNPGGFSYTVDTVPDESGPDQEFDLIVAP